MMDNIHLMLSYIILNIICLSEIIKIFLYDNTLIVLIVLQIFIISIDKY